MNHSNCKYLGNDAWNCGHIDNSDMDEVCDCHVCQPVPAVNYASSETAYGRTVSYPFTLKVY